MSIAAVALRIRLILLAIQALPAYQILSFLIVLVSVLVSVFGRKQPLALFQPHK